MRGATESNSIIAQRSARNNVEWERVHLDMAASDNIRSTLLLSIDRYGSIVKTLIYI